MESFRVDNFVAGMRLDYRDAAKRPGGSYPLGVNVRSRNNTIAPVPDPLNVTHPFWELVQGHMAMGKWHVVVADGEAWICDTSISTEYTQLNGYTLSSTTPEVWMEVVPLSTLVYMRQLTSTDSKSEVILSERIPQLANGFYNSQGGGLPCMIIQDGINQPMLVHPDASGSTFTCRRAKNYSEWTRENPEYVPIGYNMLYVGNKLYIVGKSEYAYEDRRVIFHSVTGRCLDFMVNIRQDGTAEPVEADGSARTVAHSVDFDAIKCIARTSSSAASFLISTDSRTWMVQPSRDVTQFGEPTFPNDIYIGPAGAVGQQAIVELINDTAVIAPRGIRSFNAVAQTQSEAKHSVLSSVVSDLFTNMQTSGCAIVHDNYTLFGVNTRYGSSILVYDNTANEAAVAGRFVSLDIYSGITLPYRKFALCQSPASDALFVSTDTGVYKLYAGTTYSPKFYIGDFSTAEADKQIAATRSVVTFVQSSSTGNCALSLFMDGQNIHTDSRTIEVTTTSNSTLPFGPADRKRTSPLGFGLGNNSYGNSASLYLAWDNAAELTSVDFYYDNVDAPQFQTRYNV